MSELVLTPTLCNNGNPHRWVEGNGPSDHRRCGHCAIHGTVAGDESMPLDQGVRVYMCTEPECTLPAEAYNGGDWKCVLHNDGAPIVGPDAYPPDP